MTQDIAVRIDHVSKSYGAGEARVDALRDVTLDVPAGEFVVLLGQSGSGKTTLLNLIGALERPTGGSLVAFGEELGGLTEAERTRYRLDTVGFVFQFYNLVPTLTAAENVALLAELTDGDAEERAGRVLSDVGLAHRRDHFPAQLSGGEQQRVAIARGLVKQPRLLLCDEPTGALDVETGKQVLAVLRALPNDASRTVVVVTHNAVIAEMADRVVRLRDGSIADIRRVQDPVDVRDLQW